MYVMYIYIQFIVTQDRINPSLLWNRLQCLLGSRTFVEICGWIKIKAIIITTVMTNLIISWIRVSVKYDFIKLYEGIIVCKLDLGVVWQNALNLVHVHVTNIDNQRRDKHVEVGESVIST